MQKFLGFRIKLLLLGACGVACVGGWVGLEDFPAGAQVRAAPLTVSASATLPRVAVLDEGPQSSRAQEDPADAQVREAKSMPLIDVPATLESADSVATPYAYLACLLGRWSEAEPSAALAWARRLPPSSVRFPLLEIAARSWVAHEPDVAIAAIPEWPEGEQRDLLRRLAGWAVVETRPRDALACAMDLSADNPQRIHLGAAALARWAEADPAVAAAWLTTAKVNSLEPAFATAIATTWARADAPAAFAYALDAIAPGAQQSAVVRHILDVAPSAAALADVAERRWPAVPIPVMVDLWTEEDPVAVASWLERLPVDAQRDASVASFVRRLARVAPDVAAIWSARIADPALRSECAALVTPSSE